jgi:hypothetical protein
MDRNTLNGTPYPNHPLKPNNNIEPFDENPPWMNTLVLR